MLSYDELKRMQNAEKAQPTLTAPPDNYWAAITETASLLRNKASRASINEMREYENAIKILRDIYERREQKIVLRALRSVRNSETDETHMVPQESQLYNELLAALRSSRTAYNAALEGTKAEAMAPAPPSEPAPSPQALKEARLKVLVDMPKFIGSDMTARGPFAKGEVITLPDAEATILISRKAVEAI